MLGCFNPNLGQIWTNPNVGLKIEFKVLTQLQLSLSTVHFSTQNLGLYTLKMLGCFNPSASNMDKPKCWVKNII